MIFLETDTNLNFGDAYRQLIDKLNGWFVILVRSIPNIAAAVMVLVITFFLARFIKKISHKVISRLIKNQAVESLLASVIFALVLISGFVISLGILHLDKTVTSLLAGAGIIGLALTFAFQDVAQNFISGVSMAIWRPFNIGDIIETAGKRGVVKKLNLRTTILINSAGELLMIPNKEIYQNALINSSKGEGVLVRIAFEIPASMELESARELIISTLEQEPHIMNKTVDLLFTDFSGANIKCEVRFFVDRKSNDSEAKSKAIVALKKMMDMHEIKV